MGPAVTIITIVVEERAMIAVVAHVIALLSYALAYSAVNAPNAATIAAEHRGGQNDGVSCQPGLFHGFLVSYSIMAIIMTTNTMTLLQDLC